MSMRRLLVSIFLLILFSCANATHWAYGTLEWTTASGFIYTSGRITVTAKLGFRTSFPWGVGWPGPFNPGDMCAFECTSTLCPNVASGATILLRTNGQLAQCIPIALPGTTQFSGDWFVGSFSFTYNLPTTRATGIQHTNCCRLSAIRNNNNDVDWRVQAAMNAPELLRRNSINSPRTTGLARYYFQVNQPIVFFVPGVHPDNFPLTYGLAAAGSAGSGLTNPTPTSPAWGTAMTLNTATGQVQWTPSQTGLFAMQFTVIDTQSGAPQTRVPLDFIMEIINGCPGSSTNQPPFFTQPFMSNVNYSNYTAPQNRNITFYAGLETSFQVCAVDPNAGQFVSTIDANNAPTGATYNLVRAPAANQPTCYTLKWTPAVDQTSQTMCFLATDNLSCPSIGQYCITLLIGNARIIYVSGIIRDFRKNHTDFARGSWSSSPTFSEDRGVAFVGSTLNPSDRKPYLAANFASLNVNSTRASGLYPSRPSGLSTNPGYYDWWYTDPAVVRNMAMVSSIVLTNAPGPTPQYFTFNTSAWWPIDNQLFGNEGDANNRYFTYEVNSYLTYIPGQVYQYRSSDDMWIFVEGYLPNATMGGNLNTPPGWPLSGVKVVPDSASIDMATFASALGFVANETYRVDLFYCQRNAKGTPSIQIQLPDFSLCNGLTSGVLLFNFTNFASNNAAARALKLNNINWNTNNFIPLIGTTQTNINTGAWYATDGINPLRSKILYGFETTFSFVATGNVEGFALVFHNSPFPTPNGGQGPNLGYSSITNSVAIEFDMSLQATYGDHNQSSSTNPWGNWWSEVSFHTAYDQPNSASETYSLGFNGPNPPLNFANGTTHNVKIQYQTGQITNGQPSPSWFRVYINQNILPIAQAQIDAVRLGQIMAGAAYIGFTAGASTGSGSINILSWSLLVVPVSPQQTAPVQPPPSIVAGNTGLLTMQTKDACGNNILVGGELASFAVSYTDKFCPGAPVYTINVTQNGTDNQDGTYTFPYNPTKTAIYTIPVTFKTVSTLNSPYEFTVYNAPIDPPSCRIIFGELPVRYSSSPLPGVIVAVIKKNGKARAGPLAYDFTNAVPNTASGYAGGPTDLLTLLNNGVATVPLAVGDFILFAMNSAVDNTLAGATTALNTRMQALGATLWPIGVNQGYTFITEITGLSPTVGTKRGEQEALGYASSLYVGSDTSSVSFTRFFNLTTESLITSCGGSSGGFGRVNSIFQDVRVPAGSLNWFTVTAVDAYGNLENTPQASYNFKAAFTPDFTVNNNSGGYINDSLPVPAWTFGHYELDFLSYKANTYSLYVKQDGLIPMAGAQYGMTVVVIPGLAARNTSTASGGGVTAGVAGQNTTFTMLLRDANNNTINYNNPDDVLSATLTSTTGQTVPVTLTWIDDPSNNCVKCLLQGTYNVTLATIPGTRDWSLWVNVNGVVGAAYGNPNIIAGPIFFPNCVPQGCTGGIIYAGNSVTCRVQARDIYGNDRYVGNTPADFTASTGSVTFAPPSSVTTVTVVYESQGRYLITFVPTIKGALSLSIMGGGFSISGSPVAYSIYPGAPAPSSFFNSLTPNITVVAGMGYIFDMTSRDVYNNVRDLGVANASDYFLRLIGSPVDGMLQLDASSNLATGIFTFKLNQTTPLGLYQISVKTRFGADITGSPFQWVIIVPDVTYPPNTVISGSGASGCVSGSLSWFTIAARDIWTNAQNNNLDQSLGLYTGVVQYPLGPPPVGAGSLTVSLISGRVGVFNVSYTCPTIIGVNNASQIVLSHTGNATRGFGPWSITLPLLILPNAGTAFGRLSQIHDVISGETNSPSFLLTDCLDSLCTTTATTVCGSPCYVVTLVDVADPTISITPVATTWLGNGSYNVTFISPHVGLFQARLFKYGFIETEESKLGTYTFNVAVGYVDAIQSQITGLPNTVNAGDIGTFSVQLADKYGHKIGTGRTVTALFSSSTPGATPFNVSCGFSSGLYVCNYNITVAGSWQVNVQSDGFVPTGPTTSFIQPGSSPYSLTVNALGPFCTFTQAIPASHLPLPPWYITAGALSDVGSSYTGAFTLVVKDKYGNPATITGNTLTGATFSLELNTVGNGGLLKDFTLVYTGVDPILGGAIFSVTFAPSKIDTSDYVNSLAIQIGGCDISMSPFATKIQPGTPDPTASDVLNKAVTVAGDDMVFTLSLKDVYGNPYHSDLWPALYDPLASVQLKELRTAAQALLAYGTTNGTFAVTLEGIYTTKAWVPYDFTIAIDGFTLALTNQNEKGFQVVAGPADPKATAIDPTYVAHIDEARTYNLYTFDKYGNTRNNSNGSDVIAWNFVVGTLICDDNDPSIVNTAADPASYSISATSYVGNGIYTIGFIPKAAGTFTFNISLNGGFVDCVNNPKQLVLPGRAFPPMCSFTIVAPAYPSTPAGSAFSIIVDLRDKYGNQIQQDGSLVAFGNDVTQNPGAWNTTLVSANGTFDPVAANWLTAGGGLAAYPTKVVGVDMGASLSQFSLTVTPFQARNWPFAVSVFSTYTNSWEAIVGFSQGTLIPDYHIVVTAGPVADFVVDPLPISGTAALYSSLHLQATDQYGNPVTDTNHHYYVQFSRKPDTISQSDPNYVNVFYSFNPVAVPAATPGEDDINWMSYWHGNFTVQIALFVANGSFAVAAQSHDANILHATCMFEQPSTNYRCPNRNCVAAYTSCGLTPCSGATPINCGGTCVASVSACTTCPSGTSRCSTTGVCTATGLCPAAGSCGSYTQCADGSCRASAADCASAYACAPGFVLCYDGITCARNLSACVDYPACPPELPVRCGTGACVIELTDCPTKKTCTSGVVCPDGSCQSGPAACPDQYACYPEAPFRCSDGSCRADASFCPTEVTCPVGYVKCEDGVCAVNATACDPAVTCGLNRVRCPDGSCQHNMLFCPTRSTCPPSLPVKCPDGSCQGSARLCYAPVVCPYFTCPDGSCVMCLNSATTCSERCPTLTSCPLAKPVLCLDGNCVANSSDCSPPTSCPANLPLRCPDGSCRAGILDCPSRVVCPTESPVLCPSGLCSVALDQCASPQLCPAGEVRCPSGNCAASTQLCPSSVTCSLGTVKCLDGTCRQNCTSANVNVQSCAPLVTCPQTGAGVTCSQTLDSCPSSFICPASAPVRCLDASCAADVSGCPTAPPDTSYPTSKVPCPDGTWASTSSLCATPVSCPSTSPYKCYDGTCRVSPTDCPTPVGCGAGLYKCPTGACTANPWDPSCTVANTPCSPDTPVACSDGSCTTTADSCPDPLAGCTTGCSLCSPGLTFCKTGVCVSSPSDCPAVTCPDSASFACPDGSCALASDQCPTPKGCPANLPTKCFDGTCVADAKTCKGSAGLCPPNITAIIVVPGTVIPAVVSTYTALCDDGSCASSLANCPTSSGCVSGQFRCFDGTCVTDSSSCNSTTNTINACPAQVPYRCPDGFCAASIVACPPQIVSSNCTGSAPFQCANGYCVSTSTQCPLIYPCDVTQQRCADGTCKAIGSCPVGSTCPTGSSRCWNGLCSTADIGCDFNATTGCPSGYNKCSNGLCVPSAGYPSSCTTLLPVPNGDGCAQGMVKCTYSGACMNSTSQCPLANGCPSTASQRCVSDGSCVANVASCPSNPPCPVRCANGTCASDVSLCGTANYCPIATPVRCADGSCQSQANLCAAAVVCPSGTALCTDGSCKASLTLCQAALPCATGTTWCAKTFKCETDCASLTVSCPVSSPVRCADGKCTSGYDLCGYQFGGPTPAPCSTAAPYRCFDGSCASSQAACVSLKFNATGSALTTTQDVSAVCGPDNILCFNGACVDQEWKCPPIPACPKNLYRCRDGVCDVDCSSRNAPQCSTGLIGCEDGFCRKSCLHYDGCGLKAPYHCTNRECSTNPNGCTSAASGDLRRRLLETVADPTKPCYDNCYSQIKASQFTVTVQTTSAVNIPVALDSSLRTVMSVNIPSGSLRLDSGSLTTVDFRLVAESTMRGVVNAVHPSRVNDKTYLFNQYLTFPQTVVSPSFECNVEPIVNEPFLVNWTVTSLVDDNRRVDGSQVWVEDICLASLKTYGQISTWACQFTSQYERRLVCDISQIATGCQVGQWVVRKPGAPPPSNQVSSVINRCTANNVFGGTRRGTAYAFITAPVPTYVPLAVKQSDVLAKNIVAIIFGVIFGIVFIGILLYMAFRLFRYRKKYKDEKAEADRLKEEVQTMERFGAQAGSTDDQVAMTENPLAAKLAHLQQAVKEEDIKLQEAEQGLRIQEADIRSEHIDNMRQNRDKMMAELEKLKRQVAESQAASGAATHLEDEPAPAGAGAAWDSGDRPAAEHDGAYGQSDDGAYRAGFDQYQAPRTAPKRKDF